MRLVTRLLVTSLTYWPRPLAQLRPITPSGPHQITEGVPCWKAVMTSWMSFE